MTSNQPQTDSTADTDSTHESVPTHESGLPSTEPTPAGDTATLEELAEEEGGTVVPDSDETTSHETTPDETTSEQ